MQTLPQVKRTAILLISLVSYLMIVLDISIVITALPKIHYAFDFSDSGLSWVQSAYTLSFGGFLLLGARAGDILGRRRMLVTGLVVFTITSLAISVAQSAVWLLAARALQGVGAAILAPSTLALLSTNFPEGHERTRAMSYYGAAASIGASLGLVIGGILADKLSWRVGFFINLPIGIVLIIAAYRYLQETEKHTGKFDILGALTSTLGMTAVVFGIVHSASNGWNHIFTITAIILGIILLILFFFNELHAKQPIMPLHLFLDFERSAAYLTRFLFLGAMMGFWFFMTQFMQRVLEFSPFDAGLAFLPMTIANFVIALIIPKITRRFGIVGCVALGLTLTLTGMATLSYLSINTVYLTGIALPMLIIGIGQGCTLSTLTIIGVARVKHKDMGAASGLVNVSHQLGASLGLSILVAVAGSTMSDALDAKIMLTNRVTSALTGSTILIALGLILIITLIIRTQLQKRIIIEV